MAVQSCLKRGPRSRTTADLKRAAKRKLMSDQTSQQQDTDEDLSIKPFNSQTTHMHNVLLHSVKRKKKMQFVFFFSFFNTNSISSIHL